MGKKCANINYSFCRDLLSEAIGCPRREKAKSAHASLSCSILDSRRAKKHSGFIIPFAYAKWVTAKRHSVERLLITNPSHYCPADDNFSIIVLKRDLGQSDFSRRIRLYGASFPLSLDLLNIVVFLGALLFDRFREIGPSIIFLFRKPTSYINTNIFIALPKVCNIFSERCTIRTIIVSSFLRNSTVIFTYYDITSWFIINQYYHPELIVSRAIVSI